MECLNEDRTHYSINVSVTRDCSPCYAGEGKSENSCRPVEGIFPDIREDMIEDKHEQYCDTCIYYDDAMTVILPFPGELSSREITRVHTHNTP